MALLIVYINHLSTCVILFAFGLGNLIVSLISPFCGDGGYPPLLIWEEITGIMQIVFAVLGLFAYIPLLTIDIDDSTFKIVSTEAQTISLIYFFIAHIMNIVMAIVGTISMAVASSDCIGISYMVVQMSLGSIITAYALILVYPVVYFLTRKIEV